MIIQIPSDKQYDSEAELLEKVMDWLEKQRRYGVKAIRINDMYHKGYSDIFICVNGWFVVAELKDKTGTASPHQIEFIQDMRKAGALGAICRSVRDVYYLVVNAKEHAVR